MGESQVQQQQAGKLTPEEERTWAMLCHLAALAGYVVPFGNIIGPLVVWLIQKDKSGFVDEQGKESVNFQITITIAAVVGLILILACVGVVVLAAVGIFSLVMIILAAVKANSGERWRYPLCIRFIK